MDRIKKKADLVITISENSKKDYLEILKTRRKKPLFTKEHLLAEEIWLFLLKEIPFPALLKIIKQKGHKAIYEIFNEVKKSNFPNKPALFLSLVKKEKVVWLKKKNKN